MACGIAVKTILPRSHCAISAQRIFFEALSSHFVVLHLPGHLAVKLWDAGLGQGNFACLDCLNTNPLALDLPTRQLNANPLQIRAKGALDRLGDVRANATRLFRLAFAMNATPGDGPFSGN